MSLLRTNKEITEVYERQADMVFRVCYAYMKNADEARDAVSDTFLRFIKAAPDFKSDEHEKAWMIRTATNVCKNTLTHWWRKTENIDDHTDVQAASQPEIDSIFDAVMTLPDKYKTTVYLYYYEGYDSNEIAEIIRKPKSTIRNHLSEARSLLREKLGGDFNEK